MHSSIYFVKNGIAKAPYTRLAIVPIPWLAEIASQAEFEVKPIDAREFEAVWKRATAQ